MSRGRVDAPEVAPGLVIVDKPSGWTSHDVVSRVRRLAGTRRVGHAGTLDPMATGVLVLGVGRATRLLTYLVGVDKQYVATIRLGQSTVTDDAEGDLLDAVDASGVADDAIAAGVTALTGDIMQAPSAVSAIKVDGQRAYARVRAGEDVVLKQRPVTVRRFDVLATRRPADLPVVDLDVIIDCTSGTYVRALARDLGAGLGVGGHLTALRRTRVGPYGLTGDHGAHTLEHLESSFALLPVAEAARIAFPARELTSSEVVDLGHGKRLNAVGAGQGPVGAFAPDGRLIALVEETGSTARALLVLSPA